MNNQSDLITVSRPLRTFYVAPSRIENAGKGLFAKEAIEPDTLLFISWALMGDNGAAKAKIEASAKELTDGAEQKPIWEAEYMQLYPNDFVNHSTQPNAESAWLGDFIVVRSIKYIMQGEEILKDYNQTMKLIADRGYQQIDNYLNF
jgi:hypothetical protein